MSLRHWELALTSIDEKGGKQAGATEFEIQQLMREIARPVSADERRDILAWQSNPYPPEHPFSKSYRPSDPELWTLPPSRLPDDYISLLQWSNGGCLSAQSIELLPLFSASEVRGYMLAYHLPENMPGALPFAMDGGGGIYLFDMRDSESAAGDVPVLLVDAGSQSYQDAQALGSSLWSVCTAATR